MKAVSKLRVVYLQLAQRWKTQQVVQKLRQIKVLGYTSNRRFVKPTVSVLLTLLMACSFFRGISEAESRVSVPEAPRNLQIPTLAYDESSITLVWEKPENYDDIVDFNVYMDGKKIGSSSKDNSGPAKAYIDNFYENIDKDNFHTNILIHNFKVENLLKLQY